MSDNIVNGCVSFGGGEMYYASFGSGGKKAVVIPGLSDGLATVKGKARLLIKPYRPFLRDFTVYIFSRRHALPRRFTIADMAADQSAAMKALGLERAYVAGVSQGGMIAQYLSALYPEKVERLVLAVTAPCVNDVIREAVGGWIKMAERGDHKALMRDTAEKSYTDAYLKKYRVLLPLLGLVGKPEDYGRFLANAEAILNFDAMGILPGIKCPTLVIGGGEDKTVGTLAARRLRENIPGSELYIYKTLGHALYEEAKDFYERVFGFFQKQ